MDANKKAKSALSDKQKFESGKGSVEDDRIGERHAKEDLAHMGEKTREGEHEKSSLPNEKK